MTRPLAIACVALLAGCATPQERVRTVRAEIPVPIECPRLALPPRPDPILDTIPSTASDGVKAKATFADMLLYKGYAEQLEKVITGRAQLEAINGR